MLLNLKTLLLIFLINFCFGLTSIAQSSITFKGVVMDSLNQETIPFVSIFRAFDKKGTLSSYDGRFTLEGLQEGDRIMFSYVGYDKKSIILDKVMTDTIYLRPEAQITDEITVLADNSFLYELVRQASKQEQEVKRIAKSYLELESYGPDQQLELYQGYYNGVYEGYDIVDLKMKNARFAVAPIKKRLFSSTEISKAIYMHKLIEENAFFPSNPFELRKRKMKKHYYLSLNKRFKNSDGHTIYVINCKPREEKGELFHTTAFIDSTNSQVKKVILSIEDAQNYPFLPIWPNHTIANVGIEITKTYNKKNGVPTIKTVDFNYHLDYVNEDDEHLPIRSRAVLSAYDYEDQFFLPLFEFTKVSNNDYRRIQLLTDNNQFWECNDDFQMKHKTQSREDFLSSKRTINSDQLLGSPEILGVLFFESPYLTWKKNRVLIDGISKDSAKYYLKKDTYRIFSYDIDIQFYAELNKLCDSMQVITKTVFDPYTSFYHFYAEKENQVFLNIFFDLMEIERRKLHRKLLECERDESCMRREYKNATERAKELKEEYFFEVDRGTDRENLKKWNTIVYEELRIDNIHIFELKDEEKE